MLEKPDLPDELLIAKIEASYGFDVQNVEFLPLGADINTAAYRIKSREAPLFAKLRRGELFAPAIIVPDLLADAGISTVISPLHTTSGERWTLMGEYTLSMFPFVVGIDGFSRRLSNSQWLSLGQTLRQLHDMSFPDEILSSVPVEKYDTAWRDATRDLLSRAMHGQFHDEHAAGYARVMNEHRSLILTIVNRADELAEHMRRAMLPVVLCHADIHAGNVLLTESDELFVIDWDTLTLAPRERDLMFVGAGIGGTWNTDRESERFYEGYGQVDIDSAAVAYFRIERIVQDIAEFGEQLLLSDAGGADRAQSLRYFAGLFESGDAIDAVVNVL